MDTTEFMAFFASAVDDDVAIYKNQAFTDPQRPQAPSYIKERQVATAAAQIVLPYSPCGANVHPIWPVGGVA